MELVVKSNNFAGPLLVELNKGAYFLVAAHILSKLPTAKAVKKTIAYIVIKTV